MIKVRYLSVDRFSKTRSFKTLAGARKFAQHWVGEHPDIGSYYAVSFDGVGRITVDGVSIRDLFPENEVEGDEAPGFDSPKVPEWSGFDSNELDDPNME